MENYPTTLPFWNFSFHTQILCYVGVSNYSNTYWKQNHPLLSNIFTFQCIPLKLECIFRVRGGEKAFEWKIVTYSLLQTHHGFLDSTFNDKFILHPFRINIIDLQLIPRIFFLLMKALNKFLDPWKQLRLKPRLIFNIIVISLCINSWHCVKKELSLYFINSTLFSGLS